MVAPVLIRDVDGILPMKQVGIQKKHCQQEFEWMELLKNKKSCMKQKISHVVNLLK